MPPDYTDPVIYGSFHFNLSFNVGYCAVMNSGSTQILNILNNAGQFDTVRTATDVPDQSMWVFSFVKNPYDRALLTWNEINADLIADPAAKAAQFYTDMLVVAQNTRGGGAGVDYYQTQFDQLFNTLGGPLNGGRKANFMGQMEKFELDMATVETQMGVSLDIVPENRAFPDQPGVSVLGDNDTVLSDTTYNSYLTFADAYSSQATRDLIYNTYRVDFDTYSYAQ